MKYTRISKKKERKARIRALIASIAILVIATIMLCIDKNKEKAAAIDAAISKFSSYSSSSEGTLVEQDVAKTKDWLEEKERLAKEVKVSPSEYKLLCKVVYAESSRGNSKENTAIAATIINRMESSEFPDTILEVLTEDGQFNCIEGGTVYWYPEANRKEKLGWDEVTEQVKADVELALRGFDPTEENIGGALYFYSPQYISSEEQAKHKNAKLIQYGETIFYRE